MEGKKKKAWTEDEPSCGKNVLELNTETLSFIPGLAFLRLVPASIPPPSLPALSSSLP